MRAATVSLHLWYVMLWYFWRKTDSGMDVFLKTASLSQNISIGPSSVTQNMRRLYRNALTISTVSLSTVNSDPKFVVSIKLYFLLRHITGARLQKINMPVCDRLVTFSYAWSASSKNCVDVGLPLGCGISSGISSFGYLKQVPKRKFYFDPLSLSISRDWFHTFD